MKCYAVLDETIFGVFESILLCLFQVKWDKSDDALHLYIFIRNPKVYAIEFGTKWKAAREKMAIVMNESHCGCSK